MQYTCIYNNINNYMTLRTDRTVTNSYFPVERWNVSLLELGDYTDYINKYIHL